MRGRKVCWKVDDDDDVVRSFRSFVRSHSHCVARVVIIPAQWYFPILRDNGWGENAREQRGEEEAYSEERMIDKEEPSGDNGKRATEPRGGGS